MKWIPLCLLTALLPASADDDYPAVMPFPDSRNVSVVFETFSMAQADAAKLIRAATADPKLYQTCVEGITTKQTKQESLTVIRMAAGTKATSRSVLERIYPTEYEPPELPSMMGSVPINRPPQAPLISPPSPTSYETQQLGLVLEVRDGPFSNKDLVSLVIFPEWIRDRGHSTHGKDISEIQMPEFEKQEVSFDGNLVAGIPTLLGTFNRSPDSENKTPDEPRVWFAFATAKMIEP